MLFRLRLCATAVRKLTSSPADMWPHFWRSHVTMPSAELPLQGPPPPPPPPGPGGGGGGGAASGDRKTSVADQAPTFLPSEIRTRQKNCLSGDGSCGIVYFVSPPPPSVTMAFVNTAANAWLSEI